MDTPSFKEDHISQIPALQMLGKLDCNYTINQILHNKAAHFIMRISKIKRI